MSKVHDVESQRLKQTDDGIAPWRLWGPYLSERQWGTVREDYSPHGNAWDYFPHDHARSRAYRWGEDGLAGISDDQSRLCFALAFWNGKDPILKERLFGLTNAEGNHGEDVKELYYYLDATPTHSYLKMLYKYPQNEFPYARLVEENRSRSKDQAEFELIDTGLFDEDEYFDVFIEYAKATPTDILILVTIHNRGAEEAVLHILPQIWFRNTWSWKNGSMFKPAISRSKGALKASHDELGDYFLYSEQSSPALFCENETNTARLFGLMPTLAAKDAFHDAIVGGDHRAGNDGQRGTKAAFHQVHRVPAGGSTTVKLRLSSQEMHQPFKDFDLLFDMRRSEADHFYADLQKDIADEDARRVQRQALAGMIWSKQFFHFDVPEWIRGDEGQPEPPAERRHGRNSGWMHLNNADIISMPDKWEYPWYAAWDLAFHCIPLAMVDPEFAKSQLILLTREWYMHPNGQLPAYEWAFGDVNPPVHAWAAWRVFQMDRERSGGRGDLVFLERVFHKLMLNFTWWVNRKDQDGRNIFQGGFLGLDNISVFDRSAPLPGGGTINQADGTSWMAMYALNLMRMALELALHNPVYEDIATKFFEHFLHIAEAMTNIGESGQGLWNDEDEFFYDQLRLPDGRMMPLKVRSLVGLAPLFAVEVIDADLLDRLPEFRKRLEWFLKYRPELAALVSHWQMPGSKERRLLSLLRGHRMKSLLRRMLDEQEFLSDFGIRSISKVHGRNPYVLECGGAQHVVEYWPGESRNGLFGGNSNWRGPIWFPMNYLLIESLRRFHAYYGDEFRVECPAGSGQHLNLREIAEELSERLSKIFLLNKDSRRAVWGDNDRFQADPHFRDYVLFHEYFHGESGQGVGASHQTGWTGLVAEILSRPMTPEISSNSSLPNESMRQQAEVVTS